MYGIEKVQGLLYKLCLYFLLDALKIDRGATIWHGGHIFKSPPLNATLDYSWNWASTITNFDSLGS